MTTTIDKQAQTMIEGITALDWHGQITSDAEQKTAAEFLSSLKTNSKELEKRKRAILDPLNQSRTATFELFKPAETKIEALEKSVKDAILQYHNRKEAETQKQVDRIEHDGRTKLETKMSKLAGVDQPQTDLGGAQIKLGAAKVVVVDPLLVPQVYLYEPEVIDAIRKCIARDVKAGLPIPTGVRMEREKVVAGIAG
jgi:hypothetical protein